MLARQKRNEITVEENKHEKEEGHIGKTQGIIQLMYERGCIDTPKLDYYTIRGKRDEKCSAIQENYLLHIIGQCRDFSEEGKQLQCIGSKLGATVDRTPKCHPELAGKGI